LINSVGGPKILLNEELERNVVLPKMLLNEELERNVVLPKMLLNEELERNVVFLLHFKLFVLLTRMRDMFFIPVCLYLCESCTYPLQATARYIYVP
jgi:hypothetical protein